MNTEINIEIETPAYNDRRYGKPWIAKVVFDNDKKAVFNFGDFIGDGGEKGLLEMTVNAGDIVARGQRDGRKPSNSAPVFYIIDENDDPEDSYHWEKVTKSTAYKHHKANSKKTKNDKNDKN